MQAEAQIRDAKGEWRPSPLPVPSPYHQRPLETRSDTQASLGCHLAL